MGMVSIVDGEGGAVEGVTIVEVRVSVCFLYLFADHVL